MALLVIEGFDGRNLSEGKSLGYSGDGYTTGRFGTGSALVVAGQAPPTHFPFPTPAAEIYAGWAQNVTTHNGDTSSNARFVQLYGESNLSVIHLTIRPLSTGILEVRRGDSNGTLLAQSDLGVIITNNGWQYIEIHAVLDDSEGVVQAWVDGELVIDESGIDTRNGGSEGTFSSIALRTTANSTNANPTYFDDLYVLDTVDATATQGAPNNTRLGDCRVVTLFPASDDEPLEWTPSTGEDHYALVDEAPPNTTDYVSSDQAGDIDMFGVSAGIDPDHVVFGVQVSSYAAKDDAGNRAYRHILESGGVAAEGADYVAASSFAINKELWGPDPFNDGAWDAARVAALKVGVEVRDV